MSAPPLAASDLAGLFLSYGTLDEAHRHKNKVGGILSAVTQQDHANLLFAFDMRPGNAWTVLAGPLSTPTAHEAVLLPYGITDARAAMAAWHGIGENFFHAEPGPIQGRTPTDFVQRFALAAWLRTPPMSAQRWAYAAVLYDHSGAATASSYNEETRRAKAVAIRARTVLGAQEIDTRSLTSQLEAILARGERDARTIVEQWADRIPLPGPRMLPQSALRDRARWDLSMAQALTYYLVEDATGPRMTHAAAAQTLGVGEDRRGEVSTHLARARERIAKVSTSQTPASNPLAFAPNVVNQVQIDWGQPMLGAVET